MHSSIINKIEKAKRYAAEPERIKFNSLNATFHGGHDTYTITLQDGKWHCSCNFFTAQEYGTCSHVMAMQRLLTPMLPETAGQEEPAAQPAQSAAAMAPVAD